ncbi:MAG: hypothetical protein RR752_00835 [Mucinivorans sp.]
MKKYIIRVVKYVAYLAILFVIIFMLMSALGMVKVPFSTVLSTTRGFVALGIVLLFALFYPFFGFTVKTLTINASMHQEELNNVMSRCGYMPLGGEDQAPGELQFRAVSSMKRLMLIYEDQITVSTVDGLSRISGPRKEVVKIAFRIGTFIR